MSAEWNIIYEAYAEHTFALQAPSNLRTKAVRRWLYDIKQEVLRK
jgi:hypothetical protein